MTEREGAEGSTRRRARRFRRPAILLALVALGAAPSAAATLDRVVEQLRADLLQAVRSNGWASARYSVLALSLETGDTLFAQGAHVALAPASNMKILTTAAALHYLGPDYRYQTFLLADGPIEASTLRGDLVLYGTGDPGLSSEFERDGVPIFEALADALLEAGVTVVTGDVVGDGSFFGGPLLGEGWDPDDLNDWFAAPTSALSYNENVVTLRIAPSQTGAPPRILTIPGGADLPLDLTATTGGSGGRIRIRRADPSLPISIDGSIAPGGREVWRQMTVSDPPRYAASVLRAVLEAKGVRVMGGVRTVVDPAQSAVTRRSLWAPAIREGARPRILARHESPPLLDYLEIVNKKSHNLFADLTLKTLGRVVEGDGSYAGGGRVLQRYLLEEVATDTAGLKVMDGSGLSELNRVSAATFVDVLKHMAGGPLWDPFWQTLPEAGNPRELRRMYQTAAAGNLRAKTGTIANVSALSGLVRSANGERILFSIVANEVPSTYGAKRIEDRIGARLASFERPFEVRAPVLAVADSSAAADSATLAVAPPPDSATPTEPAAPTVASAPAATPVPAEPAADRVHTVRSGENLSVIARRYGITLNALVDANPGLSPRRLMPGAELKVPAAERGVAPPAERRDVQTHQVRSGDNFTVVARTYGVSVNDLIDANPQLDPRRLQPGMTLNIPAAADPGG